MTDLRELFSLLAIQRIFFAAPKIGCDLLRETKNACEIFEDSRGKFRPLFGEHASVLKDFEKFDSWKEVEKDCKKIRAMNAHVLGVNSQEYPKLLKEIYDPPPVIVVRGGALELLNEPAVAIVGARKAGANNKRVAFEMAEYLSSMGFVVASGMAWGIDAAAHRGALAGGGGTIAVFGCGPDIIYPPWHVKLLEEILEAGLAVSEFPVGYLPLPYNFPQRNRIISGLCIATVVVEAALKSGSIITAKFALEQGREVYACPGEAGNVSSTGTNKLIRDGAALVETGKDVAELLAKLAPEIVKIKKAGLFDVDVDKDIAILNFLKKKGPASVDELTTAAQMGIGGLLEILTKLVCSGRILELPGRRFTLARS